MVRIAIPRCKDRRIGQLAKSGTSPTAAFSPVDVIILQIIVCKELWLARYLLFSFEGLSIAPMAQRAVCSKYLLQPWSLLQPTQQARLGLPFLTHALYATNGSLASNAFHLIVIQVWTNYQ